MERKKTEIDLFKAWKQTGDNKHFQELYSSMKPLIYKAAQKAAMGSNIPEPAHRMYAAQAFLDALNTFKPNAGAELQTHVYGSVHQKVKRLNYTYQNLGSMPEPRAQRVGLYQTELANLKAELGRDPTDYELAKRTGMTTSEIQHLKKEITKDLAIGEGTEETAFFESSVEAEKFEHLYYDLKPEEKVVFEYIQGINGKPKCVKSNNKINFERIANLTNLSASRVRTIYSQIKKKFEKVAR